MQDHEKILQSKKKAGYTAVDDYITQDNLIVGIGSGSTVVYVVERLAQKVQEENFTNITCIPTSFQAKQLIIDASLILGDFTVTCDIDITIDGADEVDENLNLIKGGGGCQTQEKIIAYNSKKLIIVADYTKESSILGTKWKKGIPLEVLPLSYTAILKTLSKYGAVESKIRMATQKAGPVITDNGNFIIDSNFGKIIEPVELNNKLINIPGLVETGLFNNLCEKVYFGQSDGSVTTKTRK